MADQGFEFLKSSVSGNWVILAPKRATRPDVAKGVEPVCPFCPGREDLTPPEVYRLGGGEKNKPGWKIRVVPNKFPFAPVHEIIIHTPNHATTFFNLPPFELEKVLEVYKSRYSFWQEKGPVFIFNNHGVAGGESLPHSHGQLVVVPPDVKFETPRTEEINNVIMENDNFTVFVPTVSDWPSEVWFLPKKRGRAFGEIYKEERADLSHALSRVIKAMEKIHGKEFPFNFYIYHGGDWYLRFIPRLKVLGGFELATGIVVNTLRPADAAKVIKEAL